MKKLVASLGLLFVALFCPLVSATVLSRDATLSQPNLSIDQPIAFSVDFGTTFTSIAGVTFDAFWTNDGLDPNEGLFYWNCPPPFSCSGLGGFTEGGTETVFSRALSFVPEFQPEVINLFLGGTFSGWIAVDRSSLPSTTMTFDHLQIAIDGTQAASVSEPPMFLLLALSGMFLLRRTQKRWSTPPRYRKLPRPVDS